METPDRKVGIGVAAGAMAMILVWTLKVTTGIVAPTEIAMAFGTVLTFIVQYMVPNA